MNDKIKVLLVDDHKLIREGLISKITRAEDMEISGSVASGEEAINETRRNRPDVVLMDIIMLQMTGIEAARWIKELDPSIKVLLLTKEVTKDYVSAGIQSGVDGYLSKDVTIDTVIDAIRTVHGGARYFNEEVMKLVFENFYTREKSKPTQKKIPHELTPREYEVLYWAASGWTNKEVAEGLSISVKTVETHKSKILEKLGLRNTSELVKYAITNKIISLD